MEEEMTAINKRYALIELSNSHDECLYAQVKYIKSVPVNNLTIIANLKLKENISYYDLVDETKYFDLETKTSSWKNARMIWKYIKEQNFDILIFNTAQGNLIRNLLFFPFPKKLKTVGIVHNPLRIVTSTTQKLISRKIKSYFLLNDYLLDKLHLKTPKKYSFQSFYPIHFPAYPKVELDKKEGNVWICIPGQVEMSRRDYESLFESIAKYGIAKHIKIILLGKSNPSSETGIFIKNKIEELDISNHFMIWEGFVAVDLFFAILKKSDYIMPLIHQGHEAFSFYEVHTSGAFNLGFGYKKPFLMEDFYKSVSDFKDNSVFYQLDSIMEVVNSLKVKPDVLFYKSEKWSFEFQKNRYLNFVNNAGLS